MKNSIFSNLRSMLKWLRPIRRTQSEHPNLQRPSRDREPGPPKDAPSFGVAEGAVISPVELRRALAEMLSDPESKRLLLRSLVGSIVPIEGGLGCPTLTGPGTCNANRLIKWADANCNLEDSAVTESGGNVGIGTTSPAVTLDVRSTFHTDLFLSRGNNSARAAMSFFPAGSLSASSVLWQMGMQNSQADYTVSSYDGTTVLQPLKIKVGAPNNTLYLDATGNVGIGTATPGVTLDVRGPFHTDLFLTRGDNTARAAMSFFPAGSLSTSSVLWQMGMQNSQADYTFSSYDGTTVRQPLKIKVGAPDNTLYLGATGNVGIGTATPAEKLDVAGNARFSGFLGLWGTSIKNSDTDGYVMCNMDTGDGGTRETFLKDKNEEMRGYQSTMRYKRTTADANIGSDGDGWDVFAYDGSVELEDMNLPSGDHEIRGSMKPFQSELHFKRKTIGGQDYIVKKDTFNYVASLELVAPSCSVENHWAGFLAGSPNYSIDRWEPGKTKYLGEMVIPTTIVDNPGSGYIWEATFSGGAQYGETSGSEPSFPSSGVSPGYTLPTADGDVIWRCYEAITTPLHNVAKGYGVWVVDLKDPAQTLVQDNAAAIKIDGLNQYGRILWHSSSIYEVSSGSLEIESTNLGFYGVTPVAQQTVTGSKGGNAALASLVTALANLGLIVDGTS